MDQGASTIFHQMSVKEASVYGGTEGTSMSGSGPQGDHKEPLFWGLNPPKLDPFSIKTRVIWVSGIYTVYVHYIYIYNYIYT